MVKCSTKSECWQDFNDFFLHLFVKLIRKDCAPFIRMNYNFSSARRTSIYSEELGGLWCSKSVNKCTSTGFGCYTFLSYLWPDTCSASAKCLLFLFLTVVFTQQRSWTLYQLWASKSSRELYAPANINYWYADFLSVDGKGYCWTCP